MSLSFPADSATAIVNFGDVLDITATNFTCDFWFKSVGSYTSKRIIGKDNGVAVDYWYCTYHTGSQSLNLIVDGSGLGSGTDSITKDVWHHIAVVYKDGTDHVIEIYVDGVLEATTTQFTSQEPGPNTSAFTFGASSHGNSFGGLLAEVRLWNRALSADEIKAIMHRRIAVGEMPNLIGYWPCDEGSGNVMDRLQTTDSSSVTNVTRSNDGPPIQQTFPS